MRLAWMMEFMDSNWRFGFSMVGTMMADRIDS